MGAVSLITTGEALGRTSGQEVKLGSLRDDGYTRTFAGSGYLCVNPYEEAAGRADDPNRGDSLHYLGNWENYEHARLPAASDLEHTQGYGEVDLDWSGASGHDSAPEIVGYKIYTKDTGYSGDSPGETETSTDPTDTPDQTQEEGFIVTAVESATVDLGSYGDNWVAIVIVTLFDDSVTKHEDNVGASPKAGETPLTGAFEGILLRTFAETPPECSAIQTTDEATCTVGDNVNIRVSVQMEGPSTGRLEQQVNGGSWTLVDSSVTAGAANVNLSRASNGDNYKFRIRYNSVSPDNWRTMTGTITPTCILV